MPRKTDAEGSAEPIVYGTVTVTHHALARERAHALRRPGRPSGRPECVLLGHAWAADPAREGDAMCLVCRVVRWA